MSDKSDAENNIGPQMAFCTIAPKLKIYPYTGIVNLAAPSGAGSIASPPAGEMTSVEAPLEPHVVCYERPPKSEPPPRPT